MKNKTYYRKGKSNKIMFRVFGVMSIGCGFLILLYFFLPIFSYEIFLKEAFANNSSSLEVTVPKYTLVNASQYGGLISSGLSTFSRDYTDARTWYPGIETSVNKIEVSSYKLSIPKIKLENAQVVTTDYNLSEHLVQYFGTITPPKRGTTVIYGHSTLPQLFDATDYKTIFANLHKVDVGDTINVNIDGVTFNYKIYEKVITTPEDTSIFTQSYDDSYLTLVTCTPPGTVWKRLIIKARIETL